MAMQVVRGLLAYPEVFSASLIDDTGAVLAHTRHVREQPSRVLWSPYGSVLNYSLRLTIQSEETFVGVLKIEVDGELLAGQLWQRSTEYLLTNLIRDLALGFLLTLVFFSMVTAPLQRITERIFNQRSGQDNEPLEAPEGHRFNELGVMVEAFRELTAEKEQALILARERDLYSRTIIDQAGDALLLSDPEGNVLDLNEQACRMLGFKREQMLQMSLIQIHAYDSWDRLSEVIGTLQPGEPETFESLYQSAEGDHIAVELRLIRITLDQHVRVLILARDIRERKAAELRINHLAYYDALTSLPNRRLVLDRLEQAVSHCLHHQHVGALLFMDLDRFKTINDSLGHDVGDQLLVEVAQRLTEVLQGDGTAARLGGDEFVVLLPELDNQQELAAEMAGALAQRIMARLSEAYLLAGHQLYVTASIGITMYPNADNSISALLKQADTALYRAKESGRNLFRFYQPSMQFAADERLDLEKGLHRALHDDEFELYFQPQILASGELAGAEVLLRWQDPERGLVMPGQFIKVAEETGLILKLGNWVLEQACRQLASWQQSGFQLARLSVNVSPVQFQHKEFIDTLTTLIQRYEVDPTKLELELTEETLLNNVELVGEKMQKIRDLGVHLALDDFGTGYSSLRYLKHLPLSRLKIDRSFVMDLDNGEGDEAIVRTIITMADNLKLELVAEGVETETQKERLIAMGCEVFQGYLYSKPVPLASFEQRYQLQLS